MGFKCLHKLLKEDMFWWTIKDNSNDVKSSNTDAYGQNQWRISSSINVSWNIINCHSFIELKCFFNWLLEYLSIMKTFIPKEIHYVITVSTKILLISYFYT